MGSSSAGWSRNHFDIAVKMCEYALTTKDIGLRFSKGLDPHGINELYTYEDENFRLPRAQ